jgi:diguanylate cyclase (GGDEF)-like protein
LSLGFLVIAPAEGLSAEIRGDLVVVLLVSIGASLAGHVLLQRAQIRNFSQLQKIQALHRRADADMAELARVHRELEETARTDPLTGAGNRIRLGEDLRTVRARMGRLQQSHGIVAVDLDRFKVINDRLGHLAGDEILRQVVATIRQTIRAEDAVYRFGGEEFLVIIRVPDRPSLLVATERLRVAVVARQLRHPDNGVNDVVTISMGAVLVTPDDLAQSDDEWFARADEALYRAKANGRNRVEFATT